MLSFFGNQVRDQHCIGAGLFGLVRQAILGEFQERIKIGEEKDWQIDVLLRARNACECVAKRNAVAQRQR